jgi:adenine-specific DNA-methyltransferase
MQQFLNFIKRNKDAILRQYGDPLRFCLALIDQRELVASGEAAALLLAETIGDNRDYAISSAYALLIGRDRRKDLSAYFTPPALAAAVTNAARQFLTGPNDATVLDPACGGGSFLVPIARLLVTTELARGTTPQRACELSLSRLRGIEIDQGLATLSERVMRGMLQREHSFKDNHIPNVVRRGDALAMEVRDRYDLVVGNPPYGKVGRDAGMRLGAIGGLANLGGHTNLYGLFLLRALDWLRPGGGLVFILPTSFVAGPYFSGLRQEILSRAEVVRIDLHEQREDLFVDAIQDVCLLVLRRRKARPRLSVVARETYELGYIDAAGDHHRLGVAEAQPNGEPWTLPVYGRVGTISAPPLGVAKDNTFVLADYGYRIRVGKVVPTRERKRLRSKPIKSSVPLVWASDIRPDGTFEFGGGKRTKMPAWYDPPTSVDIRYATRGRSVLVQRTSNRDQRRRLNAAVVSQEFLRKHSQRGFVAENHVIVLEVTSEPPAVSPEVLTALLNSDPINHRFSAVSGSFSVSAKLLGRFALPDPALLPKIVSATFEIGVAAALVGVSGILAPLPAPGDPTDARDKPSDLGSRSPVDEDAGLKRRSFARA